MTDLRVDYLPSNPGFIFSISLSIKVMIIITLLYMTVLRVIELTYMSFSKENLTFANVVWGSCDDPGSYNSASLNQGIGVPFRSI
jgi:hypothetical protein